MTGRRRQPRLPREERYEQLLATAAALVAERGPERLTMEALAAASGVDKAIPYRHFANRDALLLALYERAITDFDARVAKALAGTRSLEDEIRAVVELWLDDLEARGVLSRLQQLEPAGGALAARRTARLGEAARWLAGRLRAHRPLSQRAALFAAAVLMSGTVGLLAAWRVTRSSRRGAVEAFVRMALGAVEGLAAARVAARAKSRYVTSSPSRRKPMQAPAAPAEARPALDRTFAEKLLATFDDPDRAPVHLLFNRWWRHAPEPVKAKYLADFEAIPEQRAFLAEQHFAEPIDLAALDRLPAGSLGRSYRDFLVANGLEKNLAIHYRTLHDAMKASGALDGMPEPFQYAVLRGFQLHDWLHVLTGYDSSPRGELALQAFCLAQIRFPYFGMWLSVVCTRMTFLDPDMIRPAMDAITAGWRAGRRVSNLQFGRWEERAAEPLAELRRALHIPAEGLSATAPD